MKTELSKQYTSKMSSFRQSFSDYPESFRKYLPSFRRSCLPGDRIKPGKTSVISNIVPVFLVLHFFLCLDVFAQKTRHDHNGMLTPYIGEPPQVQLTEREKKELEKEIPVYKKIDIKGAKRGIAIFRVSASANTIWSVIRNFDLYPKWVSDIDETEIYRREGSYIYVRFVADNWLAGETNWYARHDYPIDNRNWGTWTLDYDYRSDLDDSVGFWRVIPVQGEIMKCNVIYSADLKLKGWVPSFIESSVVKRGLKQATQWVKEQSEQLSVKN